jgi:hypothetical protein
VSAQRRDRHVPRHERYVPREPWRLLRDVHARPGPRVDRATATRGIDPRELSWVRAELARTRMAGGSDGETIPRERWPPGPSVGGRVR